MNSTMNTKGSVLPRAILWLAVALIAAGVAMHGVHWATFQRIWHDLLARPDQKLAFRFILQPAMAISLAVRDGLRDARAGRSPYFWTVVSNRAKRSASINEGIAATGRVILLAIALDSVYQGLELNAFYPVEALIVAILLALIPYVIVRGPVARLASLRRRQSAAEPKA